jgi:hypothetical protein
MHFSGRTPEKKRVSFRRSEYAAPEFVVRDELVQRGEWRRQSGGWGVFQKKGVSFFAALPMTCLRKSLKISHVLKIRQNRREHRKLPCHPRTTNPSLRVRNLRMTFFGWDSTSPNLPAALRAPTFTTVHWQRSEAQHFVAKCRA